MSGLFDGPMAAVTAPLMARMNRDAEVEAVSLLAPSAGDTVLVIGFGAGVGVEALAQRLTGGRIVGADPSEAMLKAATRRNRRAVREGKVALHQATADAIPAGDRAFDGAIAVNVLQLCEPLERTASELARVMKPGARLVSLTHDWAMAQHAGSVEAWLEAARAAFAEAGFEALEDFRAAAEKGRAVAFAARRAAGGS